MSLDVYLRGVKPPPREPESRIYIREDGQTKEVTRAEWDKRFPGVDPVGVRDEEGGADRDLYSANITHNLNTMADEAGIYIALWRPDEIGIGTAAALIPILEDGLALLRDDPNRFAKFNPENGWGSYGGLVEFVEKYIAACKRYPTATVHAWR